MPELYLTPSSISYLSLLILTSIITTYLVSRAFGREKKFSLGQDGPLLMICISMCLLSLLFFLEYSLPPSERLIAFNLENTVVAILLAALIQFAYHFPVVNSKQMVERRIILFLFYLYILVEWIEAVKIFSLLRQDIVAARADYLQVVMIAEFSWVVIVFARRAIQNWEFPAVRNFTLILLIPLALAFLTNVSNTYAAITLLFPILFSIGILFTVFLFSLNYLSAQPERTSFIVKISGAVLTSVLAVFGVISWLVTPAYAERYTTSVVNLDHRTLHFSPDGNGGYVVSEIPFHWNEDLGQLVDLSTYWTRDFDFEFPFFGKPYQKLTISHYGAIGMRSDFMWFWFQNHFTEIPALFPLLVDLDEHRHPQGGVYLLQESGRAIVTWYNMPSHVHPEQHYTFQATLFTDGSFDFTYNGLPEMKFYADGRPWATVWAIGIKPDGTPPGTADFTNLPMQVDPQGALQDEYRSFRIYLHKFLLPIAIAILASSLFFLAGTSLILNYGLARPLNSLLKGVQSFNKGQRDIAIPIQSNDEIGFLTESFNQVGGELNSLIQSLEQRVSERTRELAATNQQLRSEMDARLAAQELVLQQQRAVAKLEEREHLARDLHDGIGQVLGFLNVQAQSVNDSVQANDKEAASRMLARMAEVAQEAHDDVRGYILGLKKEMAAPRQDFLSAVQGYCQHLLHSFGFQVQLNLPAQVPPVLATSAVENQLLYVIREALSNARSHSGEKQAILNIVYDEQYLQAVIEDHGTGFALYSGPERRKSGHFGLAVMRERTEGLGGSLEIESAPGRGTRVTVRLPRQPQAESAPGRRVLLVDDHPLFLEGMTNLIAGRGMSVVGTAKDGLEAQERARALHPDVILMDIEMPRCDGLEATRRIKAEMPKVKIVMLTVSGEEKHLFEALQNGASGYLLKSLDAAELTSLLGELLRGEISLSPILANKMLEAFTRHKAPPAQPPGLHPEKSPEGLSARQMETLRLVAQGLSYKEVALQLGVAEVTVKYRMGEILTRLHLDNKREAVSYFRDGKVK